MIGVRSACVLSALPGLIACGSAPPPACPTPVASPAPPASAQAAPAPTPAIEGAWHGVFGSSEPHLHFRIMDARSALVSEGIPCAFTAFDVKGPNHAGKHAKELPTEGEIVSFR